MSQQVVRCRFRRGTLSRVAAAITALFAGLLAVPDAADAQRAQTTMSPARASSITIEGESLVGSANASAGAVSAQDMSGFGGDWSNREQLFWRAPDPGGGPLRNAPRLTLTVSVLVAGEYLLAIRHTKAPDYGDVRVFVGGGGVGGFEGFASRVQVARTEIGRVSLVRGANAVMLTISRRPPGSGGSFVGIDAIELVPMRQSDPVVAGGSGRAGGTTTAGVAGTVNSGPLLPAGAKLYRVWHQNLDAPPSWTDTGDLELNFLGKTIATAQFKWDVSSVANAKAIAYQVTRSAFGPYTFGEPMQSPAYIVVGYRAGATGQLDIELPLTPPKVISPANQAGVMATYQVRILPLLTVNAPQVIGAPSNVLGVKTYVQQAPYAGPKITTLIVDPTVKLVKFAYVPYKYTEHWPPGCKSIPTGGSSQKSEIEVVGDFIGDAMNWLSTAYQDAKGFVVKTVVSAIALIPPGIELPPSLVATALDLALVAAGVPPNIPNLDEVMSDGAGFLAQQMVEQIPVPPEVTTGLAGIAAEEAIDNFKSKVRQKAKSAILDSAQQMKAAAKNKSEYCLGRYDYEYINLTVRNIGNTVQKDVEMSVGDSVGAFKALGFRIPILMPGEEVVVPRYLYSPEHLNRPNVTKWQLESENQTESWHLWNEKYFKQSFTFTVRTVGQNCAAGNCMPVPKYEYTTPSRYWGKTHGQAFSWP